MEWLGLTEEERSWEDLQYIKRSTGNFQDKLLTIEGAWGCNHVIIELYLDEVTKRLRRD